MTAHGWLHIISSSSLATNAPIHPELYSPESRAFHDEDGRLPAGGAGAGHPAAGGPGQGPVGACEAGSVGEDSWRWMGADDRRSVGEGEGGPVGLDDEGPVAADGGGLVCPDEAGPVGLDDRRAVCPDGKGNRAGMWLFWTEPSSYWLPVMCKIFLTRRQILLFCNLKTYKQIHEMFKIYLNFCIL